MPPDRNVDLNKQSSDSGAIDYDADPLWRAKPLTPAQVLINDVRLETWRRDRAPLLEIVERFPSTLIPDDSTIALAPALPFVINAATTPIERQRFSSFEEQYGWIRHLRLRQHQRNAFDAEDSAKCRWIHCPSKFPEYLYGFLWALSDDPATISDSIRLLDHAISQQTRYSKHGKHFAPFYQTLMSSPRSSSKDPYPMLISVPFLDWSVLGRPPPLRFQIDRREGFASAKSASHVARSVLQYFFRLEETLDRETSQVFAKHTPWTTNRELDLKVRQFYGAHPNALIADELWILVVDAEHIVTFSSNQTWKSRWPPLQLPSRISDVAFRNIRNGHYSSGSTEEYTAMTHAIACLSGAAGMVHRSFWADLILPATDRYGGYLSHLQYRLHRSPSTKLVMDLIACQEELNIVIQLTQQQIDTISKLQSRTSLLDNKEIDLQHSEPAGLSGHSFEKTFDGTTGPETTPPETWKIRQRPTYRQISNTSQLLSPVSQLLENLERELIDLSELRNNTDRLVNRTIQLVNIRLEDHGKAILVFTVVTLIFLPLNFVSSFFGMNFEGIRDMRQTQWLFWAVALCVTAAVVGASLVLAFSGAGMLEQVRLWRDGRREARPRVVLNYRLPP